MQFVDIDCSLFDNIARSFKVNTGSSAGQLPTLILLEDGVEYLRFPTIDVAKGSASVNYYEKELVRYFDLDKRYLATRDLGVEKKKGTT